MPDFNDVVRHVILRIVADQTGLAEELAKARAKLKELENAERDSNTRREKDANRVTDAVHRQNDALEENAALAQQRERGTADAAKSSTRRWDEETKNVQAATAAEKALAAERRKDADAELARITKAENATKESEARIFNDRLTKLKELDAKQAEIDDAERQRKLTSAPRRAATTRIVTAEADRAEARSSQAYHERDTAGYVSDAASTAAEDARNRARNDALVRRVRSLSEARRVSAEINKVEQAGNILAQRAAEIEERRARNTDRRAAASRKGLAGSISSAAGLVGDALTVPVRIPSATRRAATVFSDDDAVRKSSDKVQEFGRRATVASGELKRLFRDVRGDGERSVTMLQRMTAAAKAFGTSLNRARSGGQGNSLGESVLRNIEGTIAGISGAFSGVNKHLLSFQTLIKACIVALGPLAAILGAVSAAAIGLGADLIALVGVLGTIPGLLTSAIAGFGALAIAIKPLSTVFSAYSAAQKEATDGTNAAASAALAYKQALLDQKQAQLDVSRAQEDIPRAEKKLSDARKQAKRDLEDYRTALRRIKFDEEGAALGVESAEQAYRRALADPTATQLDRKQAAHDLEGSKLDQEDQATTTRRLIEDANEAIKKGVDGADAVLDAVRGVQDANNNAAEAALRLEKATLALQKAREEKDAGGTAGAAFEREMAKLSPSAQKVVRAIIALKDEWKAFKQEISEDVWGPVSKDTGKFKIALGELKSFLSPAAEAFGQLAKQALDLFTSDEWKNFFSSQGKEAGNVIRVLGNAALYAAEGFKSIVELAKPLTDFVVNGIQGMAESFALFSQSEAGRDKISKFFETTMRTMRELKPVIRDLFLGFSGFFTALTQADGGAAFTTKLNDGLAGMAATFRHLGEDAAKPNSGFRQWLKEVGPLIRETAHFLGAAAGFFGDLFSNPANLQEAEKLLHAISEQWLPKLAEIFDNLSKSGFISKLAAGIGAAFEGISKFLDGGGLTAFTVFTDSLQRAGELFSTIMGYLAAIPGLLQVVGTAFAVILGTALVAKFSGLTLVLKGVLSLLKGVSSARENAKDPFNDTSTGTGKKPGKFTSIFTGAKKTATDNLTGRSDSGRVLARIEAYARQIEINTRKLGRGGTGTSGGGGNDDDPKRPTRGGGGGTSTTPTTRRNRTGSSTGAITDLGTPGGRQTLRDQIDTDISDRPARRNPSAPAPKRNSPWGKQTHPSSSYTPVTTPRGATADTPLTPSGVSSMTPIAGRRPSQEADAQREDVRNRRGVRESFRDAWNSPEGQSRRLDDVANSSSQRRTIPVYDETGQRTTMPRRERSTTPGLPVSDLPTRTGDPKRSTSTTESAAQRRKRLAKERADARNTQLNTPKPARDTTPAVVDIDEDEPTPAKKPKRTNYDVNDLPSATGTPLTDVGRDDRPYNYPGSTATPSTVPTAEQTGGKKPSPPRGPDGRITSPYANAVNPDLAMPAPNFPGQRPEKDKPKKKQVQTRTPEGTFGPKVDADPSPTGSGLPDRPILADVGQDDTRSRSDRRTRTTTKKQSRVKKGFSKFFEPFTSGNDSGSTGFSLFTGNRDASGTDDDDDTRRSRSTRPGRGSEPSTRPSRKSRRKTRRGIPSSITDALTGDGEYGEGYEDGYAAAGGSSSGGLDLPDSDRDGKPSRKERRQARREARKETRRNRRTSRGRRGASTSLDDLTDDLLDYNDDALDTDTSRNRWGSLDEDTSARRERTSGRTRRAGRAGRAGRGIANLLGREGSSGLGKLGGGLARGVAGGLGGIAASLALSLGGDAAINKFVKNDDDANSLSRGLGAVSTGAGIGATIGSFVPGVGTVIGGAVGGLAGGAYSLFKDKNLRNFVGGKVGGAVKGVGSAIGGAAKSVGNFLGDLPGVGGLLGGLFGGGDKDKPGGVGGLGGALKGGLAALLPVGGIASLLLGKTDIGKSILDSLKKAWSGISNFFTRDIPNAFSKGIKGITTFFTKTLPSLPGKAFDTITTGIGVIIGFFMYDIPRAASKAWAGITTFFTKTLPSVASAAWEGITGFFTETLPNAASAAWAGITDFFTVTLPGVASAAWAGILGFFTETLPNAANAVWTSITTFFTETLPAAASAAWTGITGFFTETLPGVFNTVKDNITTFFGTTVPNFFTKTLPDAIGSLPGVVMDSLIKPVVDFFSNIGDHIGDAIKGGWNAVKGWAGSLWDRAGSNIDKGKDSRKMSGGLIEGVYQGIQDTQKVWATPGEFYVRKGVVDEPGAKAFLRDFNERGMASLYAGLSAQTAPNTMSVVPPNAQSMTGAVPTVVNNTVNHAPLMGDVTIHNPVREKSENSLRRQVQIAAIRHRR